MLACSDRRALARRRSRPDHRLDRRGAAYRYAAHVRDTAGDAQGPRPLLRAPERAGGRRRGPVRDPGFVERHRGARAAQASGARARAPGRARPGQPHPALGARGRADVRSDLRRDPHAVRLRSRVLGLSLRPEGRRVHHRLRADRARISPREGPAAARGRVHRRTLRAGAGPARRRRAPRPRVQSDPLQPPENNPFNVRSMLFVAVHTEVDKPWIWASTIAARHTSTISEVALLAAIAARVGDGLGRGRRKRPCVRASSAFACWSSTRPRRS